MRFSVGSTLALAILSAVTAGAQQLPSRSSDVQADKCFVMLINEVDVPAQVEGLLVELKFEEGQMVKAGDTLATVDDRQAKLTLIFKQKQEAAAKLEAENDVNSRNAEMTAKVEAKEAEKFYKMQQENVASFLEWQKQDLEAKRALLSIEMANTQQEQAKAEHAAKIAETDIARLEVSRRQIIAPFSGVISERQAQIGEWVQAGQKVAKLISLDKLRVQGMVDGKIVSGQAIIGAPVEVRVNVTGNRQENFRGTIGFVSPTLQMNDQTFRVWVDVENRFENGDWVIKPGMTASMTIHPKADVARAP